MVVDLGIEIPKMTEALVSGSMRRREGEGRETYGRSGFAMHEHVNTSLLMSYLIRQFGPRLLQLKISERRLAVG